MGVKDLWRLIEPSHEKVDFDKLKGKKLAIDLSGWIVEGQKVHQAAKEQPKMYLRNLFFKTSKLLMTGVLPVFVLEGKVPELKQAVMNERLATRQGTEKAPPAKNVGRSRFNRIVGECQKMINLMGLTCVKAHGEAEAMCAYLNEDNLVDGCITQDGDCFLYGAKTVYREYSATDNEAQKFTIEKIEEIYKLNREKMVAIALVCGCDYTKGVPKAGIQSALEFFDTHNDENVLEEMKTWKNNYCKTVKKGKKDLKSFCQEVQDFPSDDVIDEFMVRQGKMPKKIDDWSLPNGPELIEFLSKKLGWKLEETLSKVLKLVARWQIINGENVTDKLISKAGFLVPEKIERTRTLKSIPVYEILWQYSNKDDYIKICKSDEDKQVLTNEIRTQEPQSSVMMNYQNLIVIFEEDKMKKAAEKKATKKGKKKINDVEKESTGFTPVKKIQRKKKETGLRRIDTIFRSVKSSTQVEKSKKEVVKQTEKVKPAETSLKYSADLDDTVDVIIANFDPDKDFDTDVDLDESSMSSGSESIRDSDKVHAELSSPKKYTQKQSSPDLIDLSFDDIPYIPLDKRIL